MNATVGCKLLSGCSKSCGTSSAKWRFFSDQIAMSVTSCWSAVLPWLFEFFQGPRHSTLKIFTTASLFRWLGAHDLRCRTAAFGRSRWDRGVELAMDLTSSWTEVGTAGCKSSETSSQWASRCPLLPFATLCISIGISWWFTSTSKMQGAFVTNASTAVQINIICCVLEVVWTFHS